MRFLPYRPPYDWNTLLAHLEARAILGVEEVEDGAYRRTVAVDGQIGTVEVRHEPASRRLAVAVRGSAAVESVDLLRVGRVFDVEADVVTMGAHLARDPSLAPLVALRPGLRVPGGWDAFELAVRAVLGQQVTVGAARRLAGQLVALCGEPLLESPPRGSNLSHAFPSPEQVASADLSTLGMPGSRRATLKALAEATLREPDLFRMEGTLDEKIARLRSIRGIGEWTAQYVALRALRDADAFPASDIGLLRGAAAQGGPRPTPADLLRRAEAWRPWRAYAAQHLWAADAALAPPPKPAH